MILNIYDKGKVMKTYETDSFRLMWGTIQQVSKVVNFDNLDFENKEKLTMSILDSLYELMDTVNMILIDIFPEITEEELSRTDALEIADVVMEAVFFVKDQILGKFKNKGKNQKN